MNFSIEKIFKQIEAQWKYIAYDPRANKIWLLTDPYRCLDTKADWFDIQDGERAAKVRNFPKRIKTAKTKSWVYICKK